MDEEVVLAMVRSGLLLPLREDNKLRERGGGRERERERGREGERERGGGGGGVNSTKFQACAWRSVSSLSRWP